MNNNFVLGVTGASGAVYAVRLLEVLNAAGYDVHLSITASGQEVLKHELDINVDLENFLIEDLLLGEETHHDSKLDMLRAMAGIASEDSNVLSVREGDAGGVIYHH